MKRISSTGIVWRHRWWEIRRRCARCQLPTGSDRGWRRPVSRCRIDRRMRRFLLENGLSLFFAALFLVTLVGQSFAGQHAYNAEQPRTAARRVRGRLCDLAGLWGRRAGELAVRVPPVHALHPRDRLARPEGVERVEEARRRGLETTSSRGSGATRLRRARAGRRSTAGARAIYENSLLLVMTPIFFATWFGQSLNNWRVFNDEQRAARRGRDVLGPLPARARTSGRRRSRTGSPSSSPSARWSSSRSISASAARPSRSPSARRTTRPRPPPGDPRLSDADDMASYLAAFFVPAKFYSSEVSVTQPESAQT